ncbi:polysaccharide deacetylase family protein [Clostridium tagluense]|uniref:polysaccharide deacetylase family protein n=1 Tax=Clostridium tagluense TaxID=360422 RepID=UPI001C6EB513|nr:polysaccharide deacetylase family protein [Clostridium tagluense]MBW9159488.1 polysaccharide deacetylase family protein [Clostridium tagluense]WLC68498.1 polysaccharide deacetylase family protein [Clostridium tagluense]
MKNTKLKLLTVAISAITILTLLTTPNTTVSNSKSTKQGVNTTNIKLFSTAVATPKIPVLMYHSVTTDKSNKNELKINQSTLKAQLEYLKVNHYNTISLDQLYSHMYNHTALPTKPVILTFDDGYADNYTLAYPLLKANNQKATVFMIASSLNSPNFLTSEQLKIMDKNNFAVESHTTNHDNLSKLTYAKQVATLKTSRTILENLLQKKVTYVAYPGGKYNSSTLDACKASGFNLGISTDNGFTGLTDSRYTVNRIYVNAFYSMETFKYKLTVPMK